MTLSVIIATHDRPESLARLLASLNSQLRDGRDELIVAENGTAQPSRLSEGTPPFKHLHDRMRGKCRIQNQAIAASRGEIIVLLDDDVVATPRYLDSVAKFFDEHSEFAAMGGRILPAEDPAAKVGERWVYLDLPIFDRGDLVIEVQGVLGANMAFRRSALEAVGPFDERLGPGAAGHEEETEMCQRLRRAGMRIGYAPEALVHHEVDAGRADRDRFIRISRERGRCRMLHEHHSTFEVLTKNAIAWGRLTLARSMRASVPRIAREERRLAIAHGMFDGLGLKPK